MVKRGDGLPGENDPVFQNSPHVMAYLDTGANVLNVNPMGVELSGFTKSDLINKPFYKLKVVNRKDVPNYFLNYTWTILTQRETRFEGSFYDIEGNRFVFDITLTPVISDERVKYVLMVAKLLTVMLKKKNKPRRFALIEDEDGKFRIPKEIVEKYNLKDCYIEIEIDN